MVCPWTPLRAKPLYSHYRLALRVRHVIHPSSQCATRTLLAAISSCQTRDKFEASQVFTPAALDVADKLETSSKRFEFVEYVQARDVTACRRLVGDKIVAIHLQIIFDSHSIINFLLSF
jgi:hypothetical protein